MPGVQVLPAVPSFGNSLAQALGQAGGSIAQGLMQRNAMSRLQQLITPQAAAPGQPMQSPLQQMMGPNASLGQTLAVQQIATQALGKEGGKVAVDYILNQQKMGQKERQFTATQEMQREKTAEKPLGEMAENLRNLETEDIRFERLGQLFSKENEEKFPSSLMIATFTKNGEIRPSALAVLSPEAQEAIKLVQDELSGAKDTYGARVTNFDVQNYLKRLPSLLNTSEGRRRVLRDLQLINKINRTHDQGILDIVEEHGGSGKIPLSKAEGIFRKKFAGQIKDLKEEFVAPEKKVFQDFPDPKFYIGRRIEDPSTGEILKSDGKNWIPE